MDLHHARAFDLCDVLVIERPFVVGMVELGYSSSVDDGVDVGLQRGNHIVKVCGFDHMTDADGVEVYRYGTAQDAG